MNAAGRVGHRLLDRVEHIMGMPIGIDVRDPDINPAVLDRAFAWFHWVDATFSTYKRDSEISRFNRGELTLAAMHPDVRTVLARCEELRQETEGFFNIRCAMLAQWERVGDVALRLGAVEPAGLVKGWSVDRAARILEEGGARNYCINAGGDVRARGGALPSAAWRIGIQHPSMRDKVATVVEATNLCIATSGAYARGTHIINPHTGSAPTGVLSVTIVGPDLGTADAYATAAFAMGQDGPGWTTGLPGYESMTIFDDETVLSTPAFPGGR